MYRHIALLTYTLASPDEISLAGGSAWKDLLELSVTKCSKLSVKNAYKMNKAFWVFYNIRYYICTLNLYPKHVYVWLHLSHLKLHLNF